MKTTFKFMIAATAAIAVFSSCQKELVNESATNATDGVRVISVQFDNSTKASLSSYQPTFIDGDKIRVSNTEKSEECTVTVGATTTFTTTLSGELTAIYPADAAVFTTGNPDGPITSPFFKVPSVQTGLAKDAIIAKAVVAVGSSTATFQGQTALFEITPPSIAKKITVTSLKQVESGSRTGTAASINTEDTGKTVITVGDGSTDLSGTIYVALVPGVKLTDLSFDAGDIIGMKGIPTNKLGLHDNVTFLNVKYEINEENWHPYVEIGGKKWATMNVGATASTENGYYFAWGSVDVVYSMSENGAVTFVQNNPDTDRFPAWNPSLTFSLTNTPFYTGSSYAKYTTVAEVLKLEDDAANVNWGGSWRLPTGGASGEFKQLSDACSNSSWTTIEGVGGWKFVDSNENEIFFIGARFYNGSNGTTPYSQPYGGYWASTLNTSSKVDAFKFANTGGCIPTHSFDRFIGLPVRAVSDL